jgi:hypothetical protein
MKCWLPETPLFAKQIDTKNEGNTCIHAGYIFDA